MDVSINNDTEIPEVYILKEWFNYEEDGIGGRPTRVRKNPSMYNPIHVGKTYYLAFNA